MSSVLLLHGVRSAAAVWWRMTRDLAELGHDAYALDLLGHGGRPAPDGMTVEALARDVAERCPPVDLVVGHSLGAVTALTVAALRPDLIRAVLLEDPPGGAALSHESVAASVEGAVAEARADAAATEARMLGEQPQWALLDVRHSVAARRALDVDRVTAFLRTERWDLSALVRACPVPVHLLVADGPGSALSEPVRGELRALLGDRVTAVPSGHSVYRDRPALWLMTVQRVLASLS